ncbi:type I restriction enzyme S subunit [Desulfohalotomaculum tongense]|uniref:restriction endonuclease subunit S n=1 Tax=Desulforadius tongensis TaxID=1216062 RepID=UPI00195B8555|nr:type I restriction enzyme S subunit [Desulforadius tongensis]
MSSGYKNSEYGKVPIEWKIKQLSDVAYVNPNYKLMKGNVYDYIEMASLPIMGSKIGEIKKRKYDQTSGSKFKNGDTLFARITPCTENGKIGFVDCLSTEYGLGSTEFIVLSPKKNKIVPKYLFYFTSLSRVRNYAISRMVGTTGRQRVPKEVFGEELIIPIPPLREQEKIVDVLSTVDEQIEQTDKLIEKTKELKKGLMQKLLTRGIGHTKFKKTELGEIPAEWEVMRIDEVAIVNPESLTNKTNSDLEINYIDIESVSTGKLKKIKKIKFKDAPSRARRKVQFGDVIVSTVRPYLKAFTIIKKDINNLICSTGYAVIRANNRINREYLYQCTLSDYFLNQLRNKMVGSNYPAVNSIDIKNNLIAVPSIEEQIKIAQILDNVDKRIEQYENKSNMLQSLKKALMQQLLTGKIRVKVS